MRTNRLRLHQRDLEVVARDAALVEATKTVVAKLGLGGDQAVRLDVRTETLAGAANRSNAPAITKLDEHETATLVEHCARLLLEQKNALSPKKCVIALSGDRPSSMSYRRQEA